MSRRDRSCASVFYDADCRFCVSTARRFARILARRRLALVPLQTPQAAATLGVRDERLLDEMRLRLQDGKVFGGAAAVAEIARRIWWAWPFWALSQLPGAMRPMRATYRWIARRRGCTSGACGIDARAAVAPIAFLPLQILPAVVGLLRSWCHIGFHVRNGVRALRGLQMADLSRGAGLLMPQVVSMRSHLATLPPFIRQLFWVYYSFIALCLVSFSIITVAFADTLAAGGDLARALCAFFALFWTLRLIAATFVFDMRPYLTSSHRRLGYHVLILAASQPAAGQGVLPPRLDAYFTNVVKLSAAERKLLLAGSPVAKNLDADPAKEVAVFGAIWIAAPIARYVAALQDIENFEKGGGFRVTKRVSEPARVQDFAQLVLPDEDVRDLRSCRVGDCELKVSAEALARLRKEVDWTRPDAKAQLERFVRTMTVEYHGLSRHGQSNLRCQRVP